MSNKTYDIIKDIALLWLPLVGTVYFGLAGLWGLPYADQIAGSVTVLDTALGAVVKYFAEKYKKIESK